MIGRYLTDKSGGKGDAALKRAHHACQLCGRNRSPLHVHVRPCVDLQKAEAGDLVVLCEDCRDALEGDLLDPTRIANCVSQVNAFLTTVQVTIDMYGSSVLAHRSGKALRHVLDTFFSLIRHQMTQIEEETGDLDDAPVGTEVPF